MEKLTAFEEARKNEREGKGWFTESFMGYSFSIELVGENKIHVIEITEGYIFQIDEKNCPKYIREATSDKLCRIYCNKILNIKKVSQ